MPMQTLFSPNILSTEPERLDKSDTFELRFPSSASATAEASNPSCNASSWSELSRKDSWLTNRAQEDEASPDGAGVTATFTSGKNVAKSWGHKGNPRLLFMGSTRAGKSSVQRVVFQKLPPIDSLYLEPTHKITQVSMESFHKIDTAEIPTSINVLDSPSESHALFANAGAVIFIIDCQDDYLVPITELVRLALFLTEYHPHINLEVLIHKTDGLSDEYKADTFREIRQRTQDELADCGNGDCSVSYFQTSVFDASIHDAMSKIVQKLLPQLPATEALLTRLCSACRVQKAYLFDTVNKLYIATDASPTRLRDYEMCSDYVDLVVDIKQLYGGWWSEEGTQGPDEIAESVVTYSGGGDTYLYTREINPHLYIICIMGKGSRADKRVLIDYNVEVMHAALKKVFHLDEPEKSLS